MEKNNLQTNKENSSNWILKLQPVIEQNNQQKKSSRKNLFLAV